MTSRTHTRTHVRNSKGTFSRKQIGSHRSASRRFHNITGVIMETTTQLDLSHFTGSQVFTKFGLTNSVMSDGVTHVANALNCWWLVQDIDLYIRDLARKGKDVRLIIAFLTAKDDGGAVLQLQDGEDKVLKEVHISYTDFDFNAVSDDFQIWAAPNEMNGYTLYLPREH